ncbi:thioredoxin family protein [Planctomicrobium sp. SH668]|uniref:thioredoxin family protein n=1 Tax=Planctomicrobium sp. SH668 TaxID=3448126 RepID=UPI003F5C1168
MKRIPTLSLATIVLAFSLTTFAVAAPPFFFKGKSTAAAPTPPLKWHKDLKSAHQAAVAGNKPILVVFGAEWCGYCKKLDKETLNAPELKKYIAAEYVPLYLDLDKEQKIGEILEVESLPSTVVLSADAEILGRIEGFQNANEYQKSLVTAREKFRPATAVVPTSGYSR